MNPYECGFSGGPNLECHCGQTNVQSYRDPSSGLRRPTEDSGVKRFLETLCSTFAPFTAWARP